MIEKLLRVKEKLLFMSNFSLTHGVFKRLAMQTGKNKELFVKGLISPVLDDKGLACPNWKYLQTTTKTNLTKISILFSVIGNKVCKR